MIVALVFGLAGCAAAAAAIGPVAGPSSSSESVLVPAPDLGAVTAAGSASSTESSAETETVVLAGGCFWGVQGVYEHVKGVLKAESGYAGGSADTADYDTVSEGDTGHAESVRVTYDPAQVTYGEILQIFFSVVHDPTELNRQGPDTGTQYRSAIFAQDASQQRAAEAYVAQLTSASVFPQSIVTQISVNTEFYPAEAYHQDFLNSNPTYPYIVANDLPKVEDLHRLFPQLYSEQPVLVFPAGQ